RGRSRPRSPGSARPRGHLPPPREVADPLVPADLERYSDNLMKFVEEHGWPDLFNLNEDLGRLRDQDHIRGCAGDEVVEELHDAARYLYPEIEAELREVLEDADRPWQTGGPRSAPSRGMRRLRGRWP